jgi:hypothetical protein
MSYYNQLIETTDWDGANQVKKKRAAELAVEMAVAA